MPAPLIFFGKQLLAISIPVPPAAVLLLASIKNNRHNLFPDSIAGIILEICEKTFEIFRNLAECEQSSNSRHYNSLILNTKIIFWKWHSSCFGRFQSQKGEKKKLRFNTNQHSGRTGTPAAAGTK
jgi:hypothetical protein